MRPKQNEYTVSLLVKLDLRPFNLSAAPQNNPRRGRYYVSHHGAAEAGQAVLRRGRLKILPRPTTPLP